MAAGRQPCKGQRLQAGATAIRWEAMLIDSHCHLNYPGLVEDEAGVLARARAAGVGGLVNISTRRSEWDAVIGAAERHGDVFASVGIHPHEADAHGDVAVADLVAVAAHSRVVGIGETGLDYYYDRSDRTRQQAVFRVHCAAARETGLPLIVHSRDAEEDTIAILAEAQAQGPFPLLFHCFTGSAWLAREALALGAWISLSGIVTFRNARALQEVAKTIPEDRLLVETDAPFLAPVPVRGQVCEPAFVAHTARFLAGLRGVDEVRLADATTRNARTLFQRMG
jgi:TatD DNase family protein